MRAKIFYVFVTIFVLAAAAAIFYRGPAFLASPAPGEIPALPTVGEAPKPESELEVPPHIATPRMVKGLYLTGWTAGSSSRRLEILKLLESEGLNAVVVDIKDYSGYISYASGVPLAAGMGADRKPKMRSPEDMLAEFHARGIYVIGRVTVFQDPVAAAARPEWAIKDKTTGDAWKDRKGLAWLDPAGEASWDYVAEIAKDAYARGFDEINFDYVRFPSDGHLDSAAYPFYEESEAKRAVLKRFFAHLRASLPKIPISADLFGMTAVAKGDMGIGQVQEDAAPYFDFISHMVYPSHFGTGFGGFKNPAEHPAEVITKSMSAALARTQPGEVHFRPWLQAFDLGARYDRDAIYAQVHALDQVFASSSKSYAGWLLWDPTNRYREFQ